jgi:hypothetical protein
MLGASIGALVLSLLPLWLASIVMAAGATGGLDESIVAAYVGTLIVLLLASVLVLAVFLALLARMTQRRS